MAGPSRYNRKLKRKNDRRSARASRGGRTRSEAGLARSVRASGRRVSRTNRAAGRPLRSLPRSGRSPVRIDRAATRRARTFSTPQAPRRARRTPSTQLTQSPASRRNPPKAAGGGGLDKIVDRAVEIATVPVAPGTSKLTTGERADIAGLLVPGGAGIVTKLPRAGGASRTAKAIARALGLVGKKKPKPITPKPKPKPKRKRKPPPAKRKNRKSQPKKPNPVKARVKRGGKKAGGAVVRTPQRNPVITTAASAAAADQAGVGGPIIEKGGALVKGAAAAPINSPGKYTATTARAALGAGAAIGQAAWALGKTGVRATEAAAEETSKIVPGATSVGKDYSAKEVVSPVGAIARQNITGAKQLGRELLSGDEKRVEKAFTDQLGAILFVPGVGIVRGVSRTPEYQNLRSQLRQTTNKRRQRKYEESVREQRAAAEGKPQKDKAGRITKNPRRGVRVRGRVVGPRKRRRKPPVADPARPGEYYALPRPISSKIRKRTIRRDISRSADRGKTADIRETAYDNIDLSRLAASVPNPRGRRSEAFSQQVFQAIGVAAERGMPLGNRRALLSWLDEIEGSKTPAAKGSDYAEGILPESSVIAFIRKNPEVLENANFQRAVEQLTQATDKLTTSQRAKYLSIAEVVGIKRPEERIQEGIEVGGRVIKTKDLKPQQLALKEETARRERQKASELEKEMGRVEPGSRQYADLALARQEALERSEKLSGEVRDYRLAYSKAENDFVEETKSAMESRNLREPARITNVGSRDSADLDKQSISQIPRGTAVDKKRTEGTLRREDRADRDPQTIVSETLLRPRLQRTYHALTKAVVAKFGVRVGVRKGDGSYRPTLEVTSREARDAAARGEIPPGSVLLHNQFYRPANRDRDADFAAVAEQMEVRVGRKGVEVRGPEIGGLTIGKKGEEVELPPAPAVLSPRDLERMTKERLPDPGHKYIVVDAQAVQELFFQVNGIESRALRLASGANRATSRVILGYNPSFVGAQQLAEGGPAAILAGLDPLTYTRSIKAGRDNRRGELDNRTRAEIDAMYGVAGGIFQLPQIGRNAKLGGVDALRQPGLTKGSKTWDAMKDLVAGRAINETVLWTGAKYRRLAGRSRLDKTQRGVVRSLMRFVLRHEQVMDEMKGKSIAQLERYWAKNPRLAREMADYLEDVMGNWSSITSLEAKFAPFIAFYPYLRYSLRAGFYGWPARHPIKTSILYFMSQLNAEELEKLVGNGRPADWIDYAFPVTPDGPQEGGGRFSPLASSLLEGLASNDADKLLRILSPAVGLGLVAGSGKDGMSSNTVAETPLERLLLTISAALAMAAPARLADDLTGYPITRIKPRLDWKEGTVVDGKRSDTSKEFRRYDPKRIERSYAPWGPVIPTPKSAYRKQVKKARKVKDKDYSPGYKRGGSSSGSANPFNGGSSSSSSSPNPFN